MCCFLTLPCIFCSLDEIICCESVLALHTGGDRAWLSSAAVYWVITLSMSLWRNLLCLFADTFSKTYVTPTWPAENADFFKKSNLPETCWSKSLTSLFTTQLSLLQQPKKASKLRVTSCTKKNWQLLHAQWSQSPRDLLVLIPTTPGHTQWLIVTPAKLDPVQYGINQH